MKTSILDTSKEFRALMAKADVPLSHLEPRHPSTVAASIAADTAETMRGLAQSYGVRVEMILRASVVIGLETLVAEADELGHAPRKAADGA